MERGENRIPGVWRARVVYVRNVGGASRAGVYVTVPNFTQGEIHGPVQVVGDTPAEGDLVVAVAVEGRKNDWIVITSGGVVELERQLADMEDRVTDAETGISDLADQVASQHGDTVNSIGILEAQMGVLEGVVEAHQLGEITWMGASHPGVIYIPSYTPQPVARSYRLEMDIITEDHESTAGLWLRIMDGDTSLLQFEIDPQVNRAGDTNRYRLVGDFNAPADADLRIATSGHIHNPPAGRTGYTRPQLSTPIVRSA